MLIDVFVAAAAVVVVVIVSKSSQKVRLQCDQISKLFFAANDKPMPKWKTMLASFSFSFDFIWSTCITNQIRILSGYSKMVRNKTKSSNTIASGIMGTVYVFFSLRFGLHLEIGLSPHAFPYNVFAQKTIFPTSQPNKKVEFDIDIYVFFRVLCLLTSLIWFRLQSIDTHALNFNVWTCTCQCVRLCPKWRK